LALRVLLPFGAWIAASLAIGQALHTSSAPSMPAGASLLPAGLPDGATAQTLGWDRTAAIAAFETHANAQASLGAPAVWTPAVAPAAEGSFDWPASLPMKPSGEGRAGAGSWLEASAARLPSPQLEPIVRSAAAFAAFAQRGSTHPPIEGGGPRWLAGLGLLALLAWRKLDRDVPGWL
jgi:hypothetical protein